MKLFNSLALWLIGSAVGLLSACTSDHTDYLSAIPSESAFVLKMNLQNLIDKSEIEEHPLIKNNKETLLGYLSTDTRQLIDQAIDNPISTGIDFRKPMVLAMEQIDRPRGILLWAVNDVDKLTTFLETLLDDEEIGLPLTLSKNDEIHTLIDRRNHIIGAYDKTRFVLAYDGHQIDATEYLKLPPEKQAIHSETFSAFARTDQDIAFYYDYAQLLKINPFFTGKLQETANLFSEAKLFYTINFEAGRMVFKAKVFGNEALEKLSKQTYRRPTGKNLAYIPAKTCGVINGSLRNLSSIIEYLPSDLRQEIDRGFDELGCTVSILDKIDGDCTLAVLPMQTLRNDRIPQFFVAVECNDRELFDLIVEKLKEENPQMEYVADQVYSLGVSRSSKEYDYYLAYKENTMFLLPENLYTQLADGDKFKALSENFTRNPLSNVLKGKSGVVVDFPTITEEVESLGAAGIVAGYYLHMLKDLTITQTDNQNGEGVLHFTDSETNALKQITDIAIRLTTGDLL